jgi:hypothetical protein
LITRKNFVEPEFVKYEKSLDKITLSYACSGGGDHKTSEGDEN